MKFNIVLNNEDEFYALSLKFITHNLNGDGYSQVSSYILRNQKDYEKFFNAQSPSDFCNIKQDFIHNILDDANFGTFQNIKKLNIQNKPISYPCIIVANILDFSTDNLDEFDRYVQFIPINGTHTLADLDKINILKSSTSYINAKHILTDSTLPLSMPNDSDIIKMASETYVRVNYQIKQLVNGKNKVEYEEQHSIVIDRLPGGDPLGKCEYSLTHRGKLLTTFIHDKSDDLDGCLFEAAKAVYKARGEYGESVYHRTKHD